MPSVPSKVPDGSTASDEEMQIAMIAMSAFETDTNNYLKCLAFEVSQERLSTEIEALLHGEALKRHQAAVTRFNAQMRLYMAR